MNDLHLQESQIVSVDTGEDPSVKAFYTPERFANAFVYDSNSNLTTFSTTENGILYVAVAPGTLRELPENVPVLAFPAPRNMRAYIIALSDVYDQFGT